jgi:hypothetical protein
MTAHPEAIHPVDAIKSNSRIGPASRIGLLHASVYQFPPTGQKVDINRPMFRGGRLFEE